MFSFLSKHNTLIKRKHKALIAFYDAIKKLKKVNEEHHKIIEKSVEKVDYYTEVMDLSTKEIESNNKKIESLEKIFKIT